MQTNKISSSIYSGFTLDQPKCPIHLRILAYSIDLGILGAILYALFIPGVVVFTALVGATSLMNLPPAIKGIVFAIGVIALIVAVLSLNSYYFIKNELKHGASPGKRLLGLRVISIDGSKLTFRQCLYRDLMRLIDATLIIPGLLSMTLDRQNRRLGDLASGTMVIYIERNAKENDFFYIKQDEYHLFEEKLAPKLPEPDTMSQFLSFALSNFIKNIPNVSEKEKWDPIVRKYFTTPLGEKIDSDTALLFFAELCHQTNLKNKANKESNHQSINNKTKDANDGSTTTQPI